MGVCVCTWEPMYVCAGIDVPWESGCGRSDIYLP